MALAEVADSLEANLDYVAVEQRVLQDNITLVDAKSGILLALSGGFIARDLDKFFSLGSSTGFSANLAFLLYGGATLGFFLTAYFTWFVLRPRLIKTNDFVYWGSDVFLSGEKHYVNTIEAATPADFQKHFLGHLHVLARVCRRKYAFFRSAMWSAELSLLLTFGAEIARYSSLAPPSWHASVFQFVGRILAQR